MHAIATPQGINVWRGEKSLSRLIQTVSLQKIRVHPPLCVAIADVKVHVLTFGYGYIDQYEMHGGVGVTLFPS